MIDHTPESAKPALRYEAAAVLGIFLSLFLFLSLLSFHLQSSANWCGKAGKMIADVFIGFAGYGSYLFVFLLLFRSFLFFRPETTFARLPQLTFGITGAVLSLCGLLSSFSFYDKAFLDHGGFLGKVTFLWLATVAGNLGTILLLFLLLLFSLMLATHFSLYSLAGTSVKAVKTLSNLPAKNVRKPLRRTPIPKRETAADDDPAPLVEIEDEELAEQQIPVAQEKIVAQEKSRAKKQTEPVKGRKSSEKKSQWELPPLSLLQENTQMPEETDKEVYFKVSKLLEQKLKNFGVSGNVVGISPGPVVTTYEYAPAPGIKINKIVSLADDLALGLKARSVRVVGSVPGKSALGIEIPNEDRQIVYIRDILSSDTYLKNSSKLTIALGLDVVGNIALGNLAKMPHLLIAGATGAGKSIGINTIIASILYNATPDEVRFLMVDPKRIELSGYEGIPHLLHPVVVDPKLASRALNWAVREMERRYRLLEEAKVKSFATYNERVEEKLPFIVIIVDELADLMMVASKDVEASIARLAQMARAAGMHLILATQRPSVDVLTGLIKANFPTRMSFKVSSKIDSRTILDGSGAEHLLGAGDMLYLAPGSSSLKRIHGAYISESETTRIVDFLKNQGESSYDTAMMDELVKENDSSEEGDDEFDDRYDEAVQIVTESGQASISMIQRRLRVGYNRAARMIETMEKEGLVGPADGAKPREVLVRRDYS